MECRVEPHGVGGQRGRQVGERIVIVALALSPLLYVGRRVQLLRAAIAEGFGTSDLCQALEIDATVAGSWEGRRTKWRGSIMSLLGAGLLTLFPVLILTLGGQIHVPAWWGVVACYGFTLVGAWANVFSSFLQRRHTWQEAVRQWFWSTGPANQIARINYHADVVSTIGRPPGIAANRQRQVRSQQSGGAVARQTAGGICSEVMVGDADGRVGAQVEVHVESI